MYDRLQLTNMLRSEVERIPETGLPLEVFPARIQELVLNLARYENFNVEYTASILLSAVATAIGNSYRIRIKGEWKTSPSIYMMLVGRPGLGKTPPLGFLYRPIREYDDRMYEKYNEEWNAYEKALASSGNRRGGAAEECTLLRKPQLVTTVISDFTPEAMMSIHQHNPRGIALVVGLLDRFLFVYPKDRRISGWKRDDGTIARPDLVGQWQEVLDRIVNLPYPAGVVLNMADDAEAYFYNWYNGIIEEVNAIEDDAEVESRKMKLNGNAARLSLVFQVLKWATDGGGMQCVDLESVQAAIRMIGYYEETYRRIQELIVANNIGESKEAWLSLLGNTFTAGDAIVVGKRVELSRRSVYYALKQLCCQPNPLLEKIDHGTYRKLCPSKPAAPCTIALLDGETGGAGYQSAKVQCANDENPRGHE